ncbi:MAG: hypothetical protein GXP63_01115 [DPANN group archaeon]|nr:hypothetical protein [DPANN group archaeon]
MAKKDILSKGQERRTSRKLSRLSESDRRTEQEIVSMDQEHQQLGKDIKRMRKNNAGEDQETLRAMEERYQAQEKAMKRRGKDARRIHAQTERLQQDIGGPETRTRHTGRLARILKFALLLAALAVGYLLLVNSISSGDNLISGRVVGSACNLRELNWIETEVNPGDTTHIVLFSDRCEGKTAQVSIWELPADDHRVEGTKVATIDDIILGAQPAEMPWQTPTDGNTPDATGSSGTRYYYLRASLADSRQGIASVRDDASLLKIISSPGSAAEQGNGDRGPLDDCPSSLGSAYRKVETDADCDGIDNDCDGTIDELCGPRQEQPGTLDGAGDGNDIAGNQSDGWYVEGGSGGSDMTGHLFMGAILLLVGGGLAGLFIFEKKHRKKENPPLARFEHPTIQHETDQARLHAYVTVVRNQGFEEKDIRRELFSKGWSPLLVGKELASMETAKQGFTIKVDPRAYHKKVEAVFEEDMRTRENRRLQGYGRRKEPQQTPEQAFRKLKDFAEEKIRL